MYFPIKGNENGKVWNIWVFKVCFVKHIHISWILKHFQKAHHI